ncbi:hypothetical protein HQ45_04040 [Porphyromonas crevioricanis]|uniref:Thiosulfate sulfurtransferase PspE n=2 Tax=Porphyromonas crevioricanis TaxID=393921 RepID=A0A0A2FSS1_9PORP|nr:rhodanese-like domain-containing protein [Porphyromonas crevioricanis]KGN90001.1 hypothetical protein HQ45_04040 [Porphyromonas crevioricanis]KGN94181.1 hypothetical protein HQ38_06515 [Porphyromonas crevioricanis]SJZ68104.1 Rhodanese-related sulfurtransferase [Porphyromonas crevioricanis]SQH73998.1 Thiosulfate sulfurtransferase PspE precursor [Porphyromonas crevioricanis]GAD04602.1 rhodanese domain protein [Porphyromonas crevioricanis JCM 15906]
MKRISFPLFIVSTLFLFWSLVSFDKADGFETVSAEKFAKLLADTTVQIVDVRSEAEFAAGHLERAIMIDVRQPDFEKKAIASLDKNCHLAVYCRSGARSAKAAKILVSLGYKKVYNLEGGYKNYPYKK